MTQNQQLPFPPAFQYKKAMVKTDLLCCCTGRKNRTLCLSIPVGIDVVSPRLIFYWNSTYYTNGDE